VLASTCSIVEKGLGAGIEIGRAQHHAHRAGIDPREIDDLLDQLAQLARRDRRALARRPRAGVLPLEQDPIGHGAQTLVKSGIGADRDAAAQLAPELPEPERALVRQIAGDDRGVDGADRAAGDPIRPDPGVFERRVGARLIGAERAAARQNQRDAVEPGQAFLRSRARQKPLLMSPNIIMRKRKPSVQCRNAGSINRV